MQGLVKNSVRTQMAEMRLAIEIEISIHQHKIDSLVTQLRNLLDSAKSIAHQTIQLQGNLGKFPVVLREAEDALMKALSVKNKKEGIAVMESISVIKTTIDELKGVVEDQRARNDEYATLISQQSHDSGELLLIKNNYLEPEPDAPLKRGRGRPRKPKEDLPPDTIPASRPRRRPKKDPSAPPTPKKHNSLSVSKTGRPRGRPRKVVHDGVEA